MKIKSVILLSLCIAAALTSSASNQECFINGYMQVRNQASNRLDVYTHVHLNPDNNICTAELKVHGTCCKEGDLLAHGQRDRQLILAAAQRFAQFYPNLKGYVSDIYSTLKKISVAKLQNWQNSNNPFEKAINFAKDFLSKGENLDKFERWSKVGDDDQKYRDDALKCWDKVTKQRQASLCYTCSGRSKKFFTKDGKKGVAEEKYCEQSIGLCFDWIKTTIDWIDMLNWLKSVESQFTNVDINLGLSGAMHHDKIQRFHTEIFSDGSARDILRWTLINAKDDWRNSVKVCEKYTSLATMPFIYSIYESFYGRPQPQYYFNSKGAIDYSDRNRLDQDVKTLESRIAIALAQWRSSYPQASRLLQLGGFSDPFGSDVVFVKKSDNMYDSFVGAQGTTIFDSNASGQPMNLNTGFP